jgi:hypothetical protein
MKKATCNFRQKLLTKFEMEFVPLVIPDGIADK